MEGKLIKVERGYVLMINNIIYSTDNDKLSKENCDQIFKTFSIEEIAVDRASHFGGVYRNPEGFSDEQIGYLHGFIEGAELNKDKLFTKRDMIDAYRQGENVRYSKKGEAVLEAEFIRSLQQPTEIEVDIEMENYVKYVPKSLETVYPTGAVRPKLDEKGCLILKKK